MRIHAFMPCSTVNGPGNRAVVWLQGCILKCLGCWNPETHAYGSAAATDMTPFELAKKIADIPEIEGVTFSGGEPMHQAPEVLTVMLHLALLRPELTAGMFTGYTKQELEAGRYGIYEVPNRCDEEKAFLWRELQGYLDFAVMGRYNHLQPVEGQPLVSSANQQLVQLSSHYAAADFTEPEVEIVIGDDGTSQVTGFPSENLLCAI